MNTEENKLNTDLPGNKPSAPKAPSHAPADADPKGSKDAEDFGYNGNPSQSAARPSAQEADASPAPLNEEHPVTKEI